MYYYIYMYKDKIFNVELRKEVVWHKIRYKRNNKNSHFYQISRIMMFENALSDKRFTCGSW